MNYKVVANVDVYVDSYEHGELEYANSWDVIGEVVAESPLEAIQGMMEKHLYYDFCPKHLSAEDDMCSYTVMVDNDNAEADGNDIAKWKKDELKLYSANISFGVYQLTECKVVVDV